MLLRIDENKPDDRRIKMVVDCLKSGGIIIYPTDAVYTLGCDIMNVKAHQFLCDLKGIKFKESNFSMVCDSLSNINDYASPIDNPTFRVLKNCLPGPFTFILNANKIVSKIYGHTKNSIGYRIPNHKIPIEIVKQLGNPILSATIKIADAVEYLSDPDEIFEYFQNEVDIIIDGGKGGLVPSTIVDCTSGTPIITRQGLGIIK
jgi:tRNA threonylcarbamoyl adenosine modification protein (Sua5/YciO/YrdC/YwlC family)